MVTDAQGGTHHSNHISKRQAVKGQEVIVISHISVKQNYISWITTVIMTGEKR